MTETDGARMPSSVLAERNRSPHSLPDCSWLAPPEKRLELRYNLPFYLLDETKPQRTFYLVL